MRLHQLLLIFISTLFITDLSGQNYDPLHAPNSYRSTNNPNYWKNKMPTEGYWQQDVHYKIKARIDEKTDIINGEEELVYWNNSPDKLHFVYFHLYQNAFQPHSYADKLKKANNVKPKYGPYEKAGLGTKVKSITVNGQKVKTELDNTILKVYLPEPLPSGGKVTFNIDFNTYFGQGGVRRRMKQFNAFGYKHYNGVHWYPRISVYDHKFGWTTDQHLGKEFYGDFGTFDVELTFANHFIVDATGNMVNREEMLPRELREKLDIENFKDKEWNSPPSEIISYDSTKTKTWKFHAENVHDFAFTADPTYRIGEAEWNGIKCYSLVQEPHASKWQNAAEYSAKVIQVFSEDIGMYTYHKMIVADARDGMEYPMLTLDGGSDPGYRDLLAHEIGHNWFFGQVGTNETYRAAMDEGFTEFITAWALERIDGDTLPYEEPSNFYKRKFYKPVSSRDSEVYTWYMNSAVTEDDAFLNTHSDDFNSALGHGGGYRQVYYKTSTMLYNLQYVLGDSLFKASMQHYFNQWKIAHPYWEDFKNSVIGFTDVDLNWFFDQWFTTKKNIDYGITSVIKGDSTNEFIITFKRKGEMQMPIDFRVTDKKGQYHDFHIPNTWFEKETDATIVARWIGWGDFHKKHHVHVIIPEGIQKVEIDPSKRLADVYMLDNSTRVPVSISFDSKIYSYPDWKNYELYWRPDVWYNSYDGFKFGLHFNGNYMKKIHNFDASIWYNSGLVQQNIEESFRQDYDLISFRFNYSTSTHKIMKHSEVFFNAKQLDGLNSYKAGLKKESRSGKDVFYAYFKTLLRQDFTDLMYLLYPDQWQVNKYNNTINLGADHNYKYYQGKGKINIHLRSSSLASDYNYAQLKFSAINKNTLGKVNFNSRVFAQYGTGDNIPYESALYMAGANPEEMMDNKYTRSRGFIPDEWGGFGAQTNHFQYGGGLNLRGYAGYVAPEEVSEDSLIFTQRGNSGASVNAELEFSDLFGFHPKFLRKYFDLQTYLFGDAGVMSYETATRELNFTNIRADAGVGTALTIKKWGPLETANPLTIRFDMPLLLNRPPAVDDDFIQFRWLLGISRSF